MASPIGLFDKDIAPVAWFDAAIQPAGWFSASNVYLASDSGVAAAITLVEAADGAGATCSVPVTATTVLSELPDIAAHAASVAVASGVTLVEASDSAAHAASVVVGGASVLSESADVVAALGVVVVGTLVGVVEAPDTASGASSVVVGAAAAFGESPDTLSAASLVPVFADATLSESSDTVQSVVAVTVEDGCTADLWLNESADSVVTGATVRLDAAISLIESADTAQVEPEPVVVQDAVSTGAAGGTGSDAGTGYVYIDRAWVKGLKVVKIGTSWQSTGSVKSGGFATPLVRIHRTRVFNGTVRSTSNCTNALRQIASTQPRQHLKSDSFCQSKTAKSIVSMYNGSSTSLGADELLAIFNWM